MSEQKDKTGELEIDSCASAHENCKFLLPNDLPPKLDHKCLTVRKLNLNFPEIVGLCHEKSNEDVFELPLETCLVEGEYSSVCDGMIDMNASTLCDICGDVVPKPVLRQHYLTSHGRDTIFEYENNCSNLFCHEEPSGEEFNIPEPNKVPALLNPPTEIVNIQDTFVIWIPVQFTAPEPPVEAPVFNEPVRKSMLSLCEICGRIFTTRYSLQNHILLIHKEEMPFTCDICGKGLISAELLKQHYNTHTGEKPFKCEECGKSYAMKSTLYAHCFKHRTVKSTPIVKEPLFSCVVCGKKFTTKARLKGHLRIHVNDNPFFCNKCDKTFNYKTGFDRHICVKNGEKKAFSCKSCGAIFFGMTPLKQHYKTVHKNEKNIKCLLCPKIFYNDYQLKNHVALHKVKKKIACGVCSKLFKDQYNLRLHERTHTGEKPFQCDICEKFFSQKSSRDSHLQIHEKNKTYSCQFCSKAFKQSAVLKKHCRKAHPDEDLDTS